MTAPTAPARGVTFLLGQLGNIVVKGTRESMAGYTLHPRQYVILLILDAEPGLSQQTLSDRILVHRSAMVGLIDELEQQGYVRRERKADNRREHALVLTDEGKAVLGTLTGLSEEYNRQFLAPLTASEGKQLLKLLTKLADAQHIAIPTY